MSDLIPITAVTDAGFAAPTTPRRGDQLDKDAFLQLLVAQLKYQNPLSPSDPNQFMAQTAQFTMVEKLNELAADAARQRAMSESMTATALLGREVTWVGADGVTSSGVVTGTGFGSAGATLHIGDQRVPLEQVSGVRAAPSTAPTPVSDSSTDTDPSSTTTTTQTMEA